MSENQSNSQWMVRVRKSPLLGWLAFGLLIVVVVAGALIFGGGTANKTNVTADVPGAGTAR
jgi:hypothetical protein